MRFSFSALPLLLLPLLLLLSSCGQAQSDFNETPKASSTESDQHTSDRAEDIRPAHISYAMQYDGVTELQANSGPEIDRFLASVGLDSGLNYCAAFVSYILDQHDITYPDVRTGVAQHFITDSSINAKQVLRGTATIPEGDILVWKRGNTWQGHTGFVIDDWQGASGFTIEANTTPGPLGNQANGQGVYTRQRTIEPGNYFRITHFTPVRYS